MWRRWWQSGSLLLAAGALPQSLVHDSGFAPASIRHQNCSWSVSWSLGCARNPAGTVPPGHITCCPQLQGHSSSARGALELVLVCFGASDEAERGRNEYFSQLRKSCSCFSEAQKKEWVGCWFLSMHVLLLFLL